MISFQPVRPEDRALLLPYLKNAAAHGCEYSFANLCIWGRQQYAIFEDHLVLFSQFNRRSVYPWPMGQGDKQRVLEAIMADAAQRGIPCRITGLGAADTHTLERLFPGRFRIHADRDAYDYVYEIEALATLKGRKLQRKRNHFNRFCAQHPGFTAQALTGAELGQAQQLLDQWFLRKQQEDPQGDYHMEKAALNRALKHFDRLQAEAMVLRHEGRTLAFALATPMGADTMDVHFEKASAEADGAYAAINCLFARYLMEKYPAVRYLNREDDLGLEGLRKAKLGYCPHHLVEKSWACLLEDGCDY